LIPIFDQLGEISKRSIALMDGASVTVVNRIMYQFVILSALMFGGGPTD